MLSFLALFIPAFADSTDTESSPRPAGGSEDSMSRESYTCPSLSVSGLRNSCSCYLLRSCKHVSAYCYKMSDSVFFFFFLFFFFGLVILRAVKGRRWLHFTLFQF